MGQRVEHPAKGWAGTYGRLSMLPRFTQTHSPENQDRLNKQAALTHGLKIKPGYEFYDEESAYRNVRRRDFEKAIAALLNQEIEALIVPKLDRLSRRGMGQVGLLLDDLERVGGRIISVGDGLDSSQPGARQIIAFLAEQARTEVLNTAGGSSSSTKGPAEPDSGSASRPTATWSRTGSSSHTPSRRQSFGGSSTTSSTVQRCAPSP